MKRLLVCNFFPAFFPPTSGGEQRYHLLYRELSSRFDVTLLSPTYAEATEEIVEFSPTLREHRIPKDPRVYGLHAELAANDVGPECSAIVMGIAAGFDWAYGRAVARYAARADAIIHECPFTYGYDRSATSDGRPRFYNSYNVETVLMSQMLGGPLRAALLALCEDLERALVRDACRVFATSREEREEFARRFGRPLRDIGLVPNGFDGAGTPPLLERNGPVLFMGSRHPPNVDAARFIVESLAPALPEVAFEIIGSVCRDLEGATTSNVMLSGLVSEEEKRDRLARCRVALNPMSRGGGTNLKMLDYLAAGAPVLTTRVGARGLDVVDGVHAQVVDEPGEFAAALSALLAAADDRARLGSAAQQLAYSSYTWSAIAKSYGDELERAAAARCMGPAPTAARRRTALVINDFPVATPRAGGEIRISRLYSELSATEDVVLLCLWDGDSPEETWITPGFLEVRIPKTPEHRAYERVRNQGCAVSASDIFAGDFCLENAAFGAAFDRLSAEADVVVLEHPYLAPMVQRLHASVPVVYSALNVESSLKRATLAQRVDATELVRRTAELERYSVERAALIVCVTEADRYEFERKWPDANYAVVPNGVETRGYEARNVLPPVGAVTRGRPLAVFVGSAHPPNVDAARFVIEQLAPATQQCVFALIGSCCHALDGRSIPSNVLLLGILDESVKNRLLVCADFAINPMFGGGGSSLKVAEYFAAGLPTVSTPIGARGFPIVDGVHALLAEPPAFADALARLVAEPGLAFRLATAARHFARRELDWTVLAARLRTALDGVASPVKRAPKRLRLLVVTYRYTETPQGGAELYLKSVLDELAKPGRFDIEVCATDVERIWDHCHFATRVSRSRFEPRPEWASVLRRFPVDPRDERRLEASCRALFAQSQVEDVALARRFVDVFDRPTLLGGWYAPEGDRGGRQRWTGPRAEIFLANAGETTLRIDAQVVAPATITISCDEVPLLVERVESRRLLECRVPPGRILAIESDSPAAVAGDARLLGVCVRTVELAGTAGAALLESDYAPVVRAREPQRWIAALIDLAEGRDPGSDLAFLEARGPNSRALETWVDDHVAGYDAVLVQGVPFATLPRTITAARAKHVPCVALPHFHVEDPYYHWRAYYDAFVAADAVIAFPPSLVPTFLDRIGARGVALPGGGADPAEFASLEPKVAAFRAVAGIASPFVLVLGRKAGGKHYRKVFDAVRLLRERGADLEVIMIGRDEDQVPVTDSFVRYLGAQPRDVIVGALASSVCLATMSESESFGIVIVESWLAGRPVVASRACTAFTELVTHGVNGHLVANEHELAAGIAAYLEDESAAASAGAAGKLIAQRDYTWAGVARQIDELLTAVMRPRTLRASPSPERQAG